MEPPSRMDLLLATLRQLDRPIGAIAHMASQAGFIGDAAAQASFVHAVHEGHALARRLVSDFAALEADIQAVQGEAKERPGAR